MSFNYPQAQNALSLQGNTVASTTPTAGQVLVWNGSQWQPGAGASGANYNVVYSSDYNWSLNYQAGWGALTAGVPATLTLATCPVGVDTSASTILGGPQGAYSIYISGSDGIAEVVKITGGTCTPGMTNGTIQFIPANNHTVSGGSPPTGYTLSSATAGIQEAINTACGTSQTYYDNSNCKVVIPPSGELSGMNGYNIYDTIYFHSNQSILSGYGATLNHYGRGPCLQLGNLLSSNDYVSNRIEGMMFRAPVYQTATGTLNTNGTAVVTAAGISKFGTNWASGSNILINGTAYTIAFVNSNTQITLTTTILTASGLSYAYQAYSGSLITSTQRTNGVTTITTSEPHGFVTGDRVTQMLTDNSAFWGDVPYITVTSPTTYTYGRWLNGNSASNITATSITSNVLTIMANNSFTVGENVLLAGTSESYLNNKVVTVASLLGASGSPPTYTGFTANFTATNYSNPSEPSTAEAYPPVGNIALQTTPGVVALTYVAILDNAGGSQLVDISSANAYQEYYFNHFFDLWDDECCTIKSFNNNAGSLQNNVNWTGSFIWSGGASGLPLAANQLAPVITLKDSNITANYSNGVTVYNSNGVYIHDTVLQATGPWQVYTSNATGNYQGAHLENLYSESSASSNPASPVRSPYAGCGIAGAIFGPSTGAASFRIKGTGVEGQLPTVGAGATSYLYYVVINDTTTGTSSAPLPVMIANSNGGAVTVSWPRVSNGTDSITYDVLRVSPNTLGSVSNIGPYTGGCPGGVTQSPPSVSTMGSVVTGQAQQSGFIQTFVDNTTVPTSNYPTVPIGSYQGNILFWPGQAITVGITPIISDNIVNVYSTGACGSPTNICLYPGHGSGAAPAISASTATSFALNDLYEQQALILNDGWYQGPQTANLKGRLQFASSGLAFPGEVNNGHIITLVDSDPQLTRAYALNRPPNSSSDCFIGIDGIGPYYANVAPIAIGSPVSISHYIANIGDGTNWKERLTSSVKQFKVPVQLESVTFATLPSSPANGMEVYCSDCTFGSNPCTGSGTGSFAYRVNGAWVCSDSSGSGGVNATNSPSQYAVTTWVNSTTIEGIAPSSTSGYPLLSNGSSAYASFGQLSVGAISATGTPSSTTYLRGDGSWATVSGSGTVTSVAMTVPAWLSVSGSPITGTGTLAITSAGSLTQNWVLATPNGSSGVLAPRALVAADIPTLGVSTVSFSATPIFNATGYSGFKITLTGNVTSSTFTNGTAGSLYTFEITQDGTGGRTFVWPANFKGGASVTDQAAGSNETIAQLFYFDGSNALAVGPGMVTP
jgi:hypothetical protein